MNSTTNSDRIPLNELDFGSDMSELSDNSDPELDPESEPEVDEEIEIIKAKSDVKSDVKSKVKTKPKITSIVKNIDNDLSIKFSNASITKYIFADIDNYDFKTWKESFPDKKVNLRSLIFRNSWNEFFDIVSKKTYYNGIERILSGYLVKNESTILPYAELVFNAFNVLPPHKIKVVFLGQDPYINVTKINNKNIPQAMGVSFSVPLNYPKPPSLTNIYKNLLDFEHVSKIPETGCLAPWIMQGCFMINSAFTTFYGKSGAHQELWKNFTNDLIKYLNDKCKNVVFLAWGKHAHNLCMNVDPTKHCIITTSHPSPFAYENQLSGLTYGKDRKPATYPSFKATDHFGRTNQYLESVGKTGIIWDLIDF